MRRSFAWAYRWANPAFLYQAFCPPWYERRDIRSRSANDN